MLILILPLCFAIIHVALAATAEQWRSRRIYQVSSNTQISPPLLNTLSFSLTGSPLPPTQWHLPALSLPGHTAPAHGREFKNTSTTSKILALMPFGFPQLSPMSREQALLAKHTTVIGRRTSRSLTVTLGHRTI